QDIGEAEARDGAWGGCSPSCAGAGRGSAVDAEMLGRLAGQGKASQAGDLGRDGVASPSSDPRLDVRLAVMVPLGEGHDARGDAAVARVEAQEHEPEG